MGLTDLMPWARQRPLTTPTSDMSDPLLALQTSMNRIFDDFSNSFGWPARPAGAGTWPRMAVSETPTEVKVTADLPGMDEKDIQLSLQDGVLTLKGETKSESETPLYSERWHGQFRRSVQLGPDIDPERVGAAFTNGVLTVTLPKKPEAQSAAKRIQINR
jgi:HSP20 family protein